MNRLIKFFANLKFAVFIIITLAIVTAVGTIVEAKYDASIAGKLVYKTWFMTLIIGILCLSLIAVMVDRWPWQKKHAPFIFAHIGIIVMVLGFLLTSYGLKITDSIKIEPGIDGTMRLKNGESNQLVVIPQNELKVWTTFTGDRYASVFEKDVDFYLNPPNKKPLVIPTDDGEIKIDDYIPFAIAQRNIVEGQHETLGAAVRYQLINQFVNTNDWLLQRKNTDSVETKLGPATIMIGEPPAEKPKDNLIVIKPINEKEFSYFIFSKNQDKKTLSGRAKEGQAIKTDWMDIELKILRYIYKATEKWDFKSLEYPTPLSTSAIRVTYQDQVLWMQLNDVLKIFSKQAAFLITYGNKRIDIGVPIKLKKFEVGKYQGTNRAMSYQSLVEVPEIGEYLISMNEPLQYKGLTFYQASFEEDEMGNPTSSILSVNHDPGRFLKYLGSFLISLGVILLFYNKRKITRRMAPEVGSI